MEIIKKKNVLVVGLGKSGLATARWLFAAGAKVTINDVKEEVDISQELIRGIRELGLKLVAGGHRKDCFLDSDLIVVSPGIPLDMTPLMAAREAGIPVIGELELASRFISSPVIAVTGTNGKSTSVSLLGEIIRSEGRKPFVGGNIGTPFMEYVSGAQEADYIVLEVSSFQLDSIEQFRPSVALLLNISPDHLDRYPDYEAYIQSKLGIFRNQGAGDFAILNDDDQRLACFHPESDVSVLRYGIEERASRNSFIRGSKLFVCLPGADARWFNIERFRPPGLHNLENLMGVVLAAMAIGISPDAIQDTINRFKGLSHRMEHVGTRKGVDFFNDSKATNVDSALRSFSGFHRPVVLIAGGRHKGGDYSPLVNASKGKIKTAVLLGEAKELMAQAFEGVIPFVLCESMEDAVSQAYLLADPGDVVLLAPACSSFDMFSDYEHRGRVFLDAVARLDDDS